MKRKRIIPNFVDFIPDQLQEGVIYISRKYGTAVHKCCCGCGEEVVTPINPTDWSLTENRGRVTLAPSIGNWSYACRSHYWIRGNRIVWARPMPRWQIEKGRAADKAFKDAYFSEKNRENGDPMDVSSVKAHRKTQGIGLLQAVKRWFGAWWSG